MNRSILTVERRSEIRLSLVAACALAAMYLPAIAQNAPQPPPPPPDAMAPSPGEVDDGAGDPDGCMTRCSDPQGRMKMEHGERMPPPPGGPSGPGRRSPSPPTNDNASFDIKLGPGMNLRQGSYQGLR